MISLPYKEKVVSYQSVQPSKESQFWRVVARVEILNKTIANQIPRLEISKTNYNVRQSMFGHQATTIDLKF
jgi:hypothetical protein